MTELTDSKGRFTTRADDYVKWRPGYPAEVASYWMDRFNWGSGDTVADIGAGTGIMSAVLLDAGLNVIAVEPNAAMRAAAEDRLAARRGFRSVAGSAEDTTLPDRCADGAVAAQAFHWFNPDKTREELRRVLRPPGKVGIVWNVRQMGSTPFLIEYEAFLHEWGTDYAAVQNRQSHPEESLNAFFKDSPVHSATFANEQCFGYEGLEGRLLSSSYVPKRADSSFKPMLGALRKLFDDYQDAGQVAFRYDVRVYAGTLT